MLRSFGGATGFSCVYERRRFNAPQTPLPQGTRWRLMPPSPRLPLWLWASPWVPLGFGFLHQKTRLRPSPGAVRPSDSTHCVPATGWGGPPKRSVQMLRTTSCWEDNLPPLRDHAAPRAAVKAVRKQSGRSALRVTRAAPHAGLGLNGRTT